MVQKVPLKLAFVIIQPVEIELEQSKEKSESSVDS